MKILGSLFFLLGSILFQLEVFGQINLDSLEAVRMEAYTAKIQKEKDERLLAFSKLNPDSVVVLNLRKLSLYEFPDLGEYSELEELDISLNEITYFNLKEIGSDRLKTLYLSENPLEKIRFRKNDSIQTLKLNDCKLHKIPRSIRKLKGLKRLELEHNQISKVPGFIKRMKKLEEISVSFNGIQISERDLKHCQHIKVVQFIGNELSSLPENIGVMQGTKKLNFSQNNLSNLPASLSELDSLESLIFYKNKFEEIPPLVFELHSLQELDFYYNSLTEIPEGISKMNSLELLFISYNQISLLPESLKDLDQLKRLYIHHNLLIGLPPWIVDFKNLEVLDVGFNKLSVAPDFSKAVGLVEVDVQENNLSEVPWSILTLPNLERVFIKNNPFELSVEEAQHLKELVEDLLERGVRVSF